MFSVSFTIDIDQYPSSTPASKSRILAPSSLDFHRFYSGAAGRRISSPLQQPHCYADCRGGHENLVCSLLLGGASPSAKDKKGDTPLHLAAWRGRAGIASALLLKGAQMNALDSQGRVRAGRVGVLHKRTAGRALNDCSLGRVRVHRC